MKIAIRVGGPTSGGREQFESMLEFAVEADGHSGGGEMVVNLLFDVTDFTAGGGEDIQVLPAPQVERGQEEPDLSR